jgi:hypothetical protein
MSMVVGEDVLHGKQDAECEEERGDSLGAKISHKAVHIYYLANNYNSIALVILHLQIYF